MRAVAAELIKPGPQSRWIVKISLANHGPDTIPKPDHGLAVAVGRTAVLHTLGVDMFKLGRQLEDLPWLGSCEKLNASSQAGHGLSPTWGPRPGRRPALLAIDHVLTDRACAVLTTSAHRLPGSDHRALYAELQLPAPHSPEDQTPPTIT